MGDTERVGPGLRGCSGLGASSGASQRTILSARTGGIRVTASRATRGMDSWIDVQVEDRAGLRCADEVGLRPEALAGQDMASRRDHGGRGGDLGRLPERMSRVMLTQASS